MTRHNDGSLPANSSQSQRNAHQRASKRRNGEWMTKLEATTPRKIKFLKGSKGGVVGSRYVTKRNARGR